ncbi:E3 ubiquitin- ligase RNF4-like [Brachionus plicatilis]|uniref:E3 ubiquitin-ligase RNF4-like n=1 Tax=Brachionus plicatilis TaxID=10195 RepID=A0A3M7PEG8_BRAPC|nr:E3 ubiquitin- ligase RNF4-like [Brachionus plicatilis]
MQQSPLNSDYTSQINTNRNSVLSYDSVIKNGVEVLYPVSFNCITTQDAYRNKSLEEIRHEDYLLNRKYPQSTNVLKDFSKSEGTRFYRYKPVCGVDFKTNKYTQQSYPRDTFLTHISTMLEYEKFSPEELRFEDYKNGLKLKKKSDKNNNVDDSSDLACCPICLEQILQLKKEGVRLNVSICGHIICKNCTSQMLRKMNKSRFECPSCRRSLKSQDIHELFI